MDSLQGTPLGRDSEYLDQYDPTVLCPVPRTQARTDLVLGRDEALPFTGCDIWNAYELSWLNGRGKPMVAMAQLTVPCSSPNIIESKSLKLYLNSFANTRIDGPPDTVRETIRADLAAVAGAPLEVTVQSLTQAAHRPVWQDQGQLVDTLDLAFDGFAYDPGLLATDNGAGQSGAFTSHLLRSHCPVTGQPDWGSVQVRFTEARLSAAGFLRYLVSLRNHQGFHEQVIERIFIDVLRYCRPRELSVYGRFTRRGGLDINPFRSNCEPAPSNRRTVRQ